MRLIDADALIEKCGEWYTEEGSEVGFIGTLKQLLDKQPTVNQWIPCSERLPKKERATYLICTESGYMYSCRWTNDMYGLGLHEWSEWGWHIMDMPQYAKVVAWMEMEPWKGADDEREDIQSADE